MFVGMLFAGFFCMLSGMEGVAVGNVCMVTGRFMVAFFVVLGSFEMMSCRFFMMFGSFFVVLGTFMGHGDLISFSTTELVLLQHPQSKDRL
ncbi:MAG TPA: hypothetical protein VGG97_25570 [Bryobacteraceae bacterium]